MSLTLKIYENKNKGIKRLFPNDDEMETAEKIMEARSVLKSLRGIESECIPLPSVLRLHFSRATFLAEFLTNQAYTDDPSRNGWISKEGDYEIKLQNEDDQYCKTPKEMMMFCSCRTKCSSRCKCKKSDSVLKTCSRLLCKSCKCYTKEIEGENEDPVISLRYQSFMDQLSSDESEEEEDELDASIELDMDFPNLDEDESDEYF